MMTKTNKPFHYYNDVVEFLKFYIKKNKKRVTLEYVLQDESIMAQAEDMMNRENESRRQRFRDNSNNNPQNLLAAQKASAELECWKIGWEVAHKNYKIWQQTDDYQKWVINKSNIMSENRNDPDSEWNKNMRISHLNSEAKRKSELENIKIANEHAHYNVTCPVCNKQGDAVVMPRHHFDNCTFDKVKELEVVNSIEDNHVFKNKNEIKDLFISSGFDLNYFGKYNIFDKYFRKLDPSKKTSGRCIKQKN